MIIYGYRNRKIEQSGGMFHCPRCQVQCSYKRYSMERYLTLFFIPLFRLGRLGEYVECQTCFTTYKPEVLGNSFLGSLSAGLDPQAPLIPDSQPAQKGKSPGCGLAALGGSLFACGGLIGLFAVWVQLTGERGPTDNLEGFIGVMVLCPIPLLVLGGILLAVWGLAWFRNRQSAQP